MIKVKLYRNMKSELKELEKEKETLQSPWFWSVNSMKFLISVTE